MFLFIEPICKNIGAYVPAYPLPLMEIASFVKASLPDVEIGIFSMPVDYGLPLTGEGRERIYEELLRDLSRLKPTAVGISCTAIAQAEEVISLSERIKKDHPGTLIFIGGYFPTVYYSEIFSRTSAIDLIVIGEGEEPSLKIIEHLIKGKDPRDEDIPNLAWKEGEGNIHLTRTGARFDLRQKKIQNLDLLKYPSAYEVLPYAFSRGCPFHCHFCMEEFIRPVRKEVPSEIVRKDLENLSRRSKAKTLLISDALFQSIDLFPFLRSLGMKVNFETRCDTFDASIIPQIADTCGFIALGFESASYDTLRRMNKVKDKSHYEKYMTNAKAIIKEAVNGEIPIMVFMIAGYPGDTQKDLEESLLFAKELSKFKGPGGHIFKIGECRVYPKTRVHDKVLALPDVEYDNDGVFGENVVRRPSKDVDFSMILDYMKKIFNLSNPTLKLQNSILNIMPFFRLPAQALGDAIIPDVCYRGNDRQIFNVQGESLTVFKTIAPLLKDKYKELMSGQRAHRNLSF